ncbi:hypothetical protein Cpir12675_003114 [Ceratocystis pirilliformis]|uniref:NIPA-like protein 2 n=1 Tax=Ceratocystis pirilliformis TaxID=259994 RepID=A0ABR3Z7C5_9PEZI
MSLPATFSGASSSSPSFLAPTSSLLWPLNPTISPLPSDEPSQNHPEADKDWSQIIGIATAITGNILVALALNVQRFAHIKLHQKRIQIKAIAEQSEQEAQRAKFYPSHDNAYQNPRHHHSLHDREYDFCHHRSQNSQDVSWFSAATTTTTNNNAASAQTLDGALDDNNTSIAAPRHGTSDVSFSGYGAVSTVHFPSRPLSRTVSAAAYSSRASSESTRPLGHDSSLPSEKASSLSYLHSSYWWLGQILIILGEMGNFLAYGFAPASIVSPLGVVALVSNCVIAPILFHERFRARDAWGVMTAVAGVVIVVMSAGGDESKLQPHDIWDAIAAPAFEVYLCVTVAMIAALMWASKCYGKRTILIDLGLVGLFGGYTALATKGISSMLSSNPWGALRTPVTYTLLLVLILTAVMQIRYLNRALQRFDSTQVIPIQFVMFTLCVIVGSAVLYRDFERTTLAQSIKFVSGCLLTFFGVFLITSDRPRPGDEESHLLESDGLDETIGLGPHEAYTDISPFDTPRSSFDSRRSSREGHLNYPIERRISLAHETGIPSSRMPPPSRPSLADYHQHHSTSNIWSNEPFDPPAIRPDPTPLQHRPDTENHPVSAISEPPTTVMTLEPSTPPGTSYGPQAHADYTSAVAPTCCASGGRRFAGPVISASPFSSAVSAVITDSLRHKNPLARRTSLGRIWSSIRAGMFMDNEGTEENSMLGSRQPLLSSLLETNESAVPPRPSTSRERSCNDPRSRRRRHRSLSDTLNGLFAPGRGYAGSMDEPALGQ